MEVQMWAIPFQTVWSLSAERCVMLRLSRARTGGWWPTAPMPPIQCLQRWAQNMLPFLPISSGDAMATRRKRNRALLTIPCMPSHPWWNIWSLLFLFFSAEITESFNVEPPSPHRCYFFPALPPPCSPSLRHLLHGYGSKCEALIKLWLLCFKGLAPGQSFPCVTSLNLAPSDFHSSLHTQRNINQQSQLS